MKKFAGSKNHKFNRTRLIGLTAILLAAVVFISALPNLRAQTASSRSFFGLADLFSWQKAAITPPTSGANDDIIAAPLDTKTVCSAGADFATLTLAVADANTAVPAGGRTYNVCAGFTETAPAGGYSITATGASAANPVVFVKSGAGANPTITASAALTAGALNDAIFKIIGADNIRPYA